MPTLLEKRDLAQAALKEAQRLLQQGFEVHLSAGKLLKIPELKETGERLERYAEQYRKDSGRYATEARRLLSEINSELG